MRRLNTHIRPGKCLGRTVDLNSGGGGASYFCDTYSPFAFIDVARQGKSDQTQMVEVREDGGGTYEWIGPSAGLLDETALLAHTGVNSGFSRTVKDATGNGHDVTQATAVNQPRIVNAGTVDKENGKPALVPNPAGTGRGLLQSAAFTAESQPGTVFAVANLHPSNLRFAFSGGATNTWWIFGSGAHYADAGASINDAVAPSGSQELLSVLFNTTSSVMRKNGAQIASGNIGTKTLDKISIGWNDSVNAFPDSFQSAIVFNDNQSASFSDIETDINTFYETYA